VPIIGRTDCANQRRHKVVVEDLAIYQAPRAADGTVLALLPVRFAAAYADPLRSPLAHEVQSGEQTIDLDLEMPRSFELNANGTRRIP